MDTHTHTPDVCLMKSPPNQWMNQKNLGVTKNNRGHTSDYKMEEKLFLKKIKKKKGFKRLEILSVGINCLHLVVDSRLRDTREKSR